MDTLGSGESGVALTLATALQNASRLRWVWNGAPASWSAVAEMPGHPGIGDTAFERLRVRFDPVPAAPIMEPIYVSLRSLLLCLSALKPFARTATGHQRFMRFRLSLPE